MQTIRIFSQGSGIEFGIEKIYQTCNEKKKQKKEEMYEIRKVSEKLQKTKLQEQQVYNIN